MKSKAILFILLMFLFVFIVSAVTYSENQEVTLVEGEGVFVQIDDVSYKVFLDPFLGNRVGFEVDGKQYNTLVSEGGSILLDNGITISVIEIYQIGNNGYVKFKMFSENVEPSQVRVPTETNRPSIDRNAVVANYQQRQNISTIFLILALIVALAIGIFLMVYMIKNASRIPNLIIYGLVFLGAVIWFISMIFGLISQLISYGSIADPDIIEIGWPSILLLIFSGYFVFNLIRKGDFAERMKYSLNLFSGGIITSVLALLFTIVTAIIFSLDGLGLVLMGILIFTVGAIGSFVLGIIGFLIDKFHK